MSTTQTKTQTTTPWAAGIIFSNWRLKDIITFLEDEINATAEDFGVMRVDRTRKKGKDGAPGEWKETNRTIVLVKRSLLDAATDMGFGRFNRGLDFKFVEYENREHGFPRPGYTSNLYIPVPEKLSASEAKGQIEFKLKILEDFGLFTVTFTDKKTKKEVTKTLTPRVAIPGSSRESDDHRGRAFVSFSDLVPLDTLATVRTLLHCTKLYLSEDEGDNVLMECRWAKELKKRDGKGKGRGKGKGKGRRKAPPKKIVKTAPAKFKPIPTGESQWSKPLEIKPDTPSPEVVKPEVTETVETPTFEVVKPEVTETVETPTAEVVEPETVETSETVETPVVETKVFAPMDFPPL